MVTRRGVARKNIIFEERTDNLTLARSLEVASTKPWHLRVDYVTRSFMLGKEQWSDQTGNCPTILPIAVALPSYQV
jgi:hypothetical protein